MDDLAGDIYQWTSPVYEHSFVSDQALVALDRFLTDVVDPLVQQGRIEYSTPSDIYRSYLAWEDSTGR
jgi:hypothetical protein